MCWLFQVRRDPFPFFESCWGDSLFVCLVAKPYAILQFQPWSAGQLCSLKEDQLALAGQVSPQEPFRSPCYFVRRFKSLVGFTVYRRST